MYFINSKNISLKNGLNVNQRGFGLVELLVSISIIAMVSSIVLVRNNSFNGAVILRDQAYEVAFALKQAQLMAVSGSDVSGANSHTFGIYFDKDNNQQYITFRDEGIQSGRYESGVDVQVGLTGHLDKRFKIRGVTYLDGTSAGDYISVTFARPNFDAIVKRANSGTALAVGSVRRVKITPAGQISVVTY
jgi:prepilin-type N-terminal cleavage/methylation domain-containing protein